MSDQEFTATEIQQQADNIILLKHMIMEMQRLINPEIMKRMKIDLMERLSREQSISPILMLMNTGMQVRRNSEATKNAYNFCSFLEQIKKYDVTVDMAVQELALPEENNSDHEV